MPTETFNNLPIEKRERFIEESLKEFAVYNYDSASINRIIKNLGIARGSVYQYFTDKLDLWLFLKEYAENEKVKMIRSVKREEYSSFWDYYKAMYEKGIDFDLEQPLCSQFLYRMGFNENGQAVLPYLKSWEAKAKSMFSMLVEHEKSQGAFDREISTDIMVHYLFTMSRSIADLLQSQYQIDFEANIKMGKPLYAGNKEELLKAVSELILLMEKSFKPKI